MGCERGCADSAAAGGAEAREVETVSIVGGDDAVVVVAAAAAAGVPDTCGVWGGRPFASGATRKPLK